jgi:hypothetical protein
MGMDGTSKLVGVVLACLACAFFVACTDTTAPRSGGLPGDLGGGPSVDAEPDAKGPTDAGLDVGEAPDTAVDASTE